MSDAATLYVRDGLTIAEVARRLGIKPDKAMKMLWAAGVKMRSPGPPRGKTGVAEAIKAGIARSKSPYYRRNRP